MPVLDGDGVPRRAKLPEEHPFSCKPRKIILAEY